MRPNYFPADQPPAATNPMHLQSTYTAHLQHPSNQRCNSNLVEHLWWSFFAEIVDVFRPLAISAEEFHRRCWIGF